MIQNGTCLNVIDNCGAREVYCIKVSKGYRRRYARMGDVITVVVKKLRKKRKKTARIKKGDISKALVVRTRTSKILPYYEFLKFKENSVVLLTKQNKLLGTRVFGAMPFFFKFTRFLRITSVCSGLIK